MGITNRSGEASFGTRFGERVRRERTRLGLSQNVLADLAEMSAQKLCDLERGRGPTRPSFERIDALAAALGTTADDLTRGLVRRRSRRTSKQVANQS